MAFRLVRDELNCSICLSMYQDPVTLNCGHNFCLSCIQSLLTTQRVRVHTCPECRQKLEKPPVLRRNFNLRNMAEWFRCSQAGQEESGKFCTYCLQSQVPAMKSCIHCDAFLCDDHLRVHNKSEEHCLVEITNSFEDRECCVHKKTFKYYCSDHEHFLCVLCRMDEDHVGHNTVSINVAYKKKRKELISIRDKLILRKDKMRKRLQKPHRHQTEAMEELSERETGIPALVKQISKQLNILKNQICSGFSNHKNKVLESICKQIKDLEKREETLSSMEDDIELLLDKTDPFLFLKGWRENYTSFRDALDPEEDHIFQEVDKSNEALIVDTQHIRLWDIWDIFFDSNIFLDINTAGNLLEVSCNLKGVSRSKVSQNRPETPERFLYFQVVSCNVLSSGRHFWEVETSESGFWMVGVCYPSIDRKENQPCIGSNTKSWSLCSYNRQYSARHNNVITQLKPATSSRLRIFLNYDVGRLSFCEISDRFKHLHTFNVTFTEPLHAAFWVWDGWINIRNEKDFCIASLS